MQVDLHGAHGPNSACAISRLVMPSAASRATTGVAGAVFEVAGEVPRRLAVVMPLTTKEKGPSDLSVELILIEVMSGLWLTEIDNIHVL